MLEVLDNANVNARWGNQAPSVTSSAVFSMFGGGAKKEKKEEEDRGDVSGSAKAQRDAAAAAAGEAKADDVCVPAKHVPFLASKTIMC